MLPLVGSATLQVPQFALKFSCLYIFNLSSFAEKVSFAEGLALRAEWLASLKN
jgi:hypothetical protein